ncbi:hypothetical protein KV697_16795 [Sphingomonas sanguinis]|nr:hypothetical protein KV697_16795 [Sphingomonas sanguinis]
MSPSLRAAILAVAISGLPVTAATIAGDDPRSIAVPGDGGWDYARVDEKADRLYVAHGDTVAVVDLASGRALAPLGPVAHAHAVVPLPNGELAVTSGDDDSVRFFEPGAGQQVASVGVGRKPDAAIVDPANGHLLTMDAKSGVISDIDADTHRVVRTIKVAAGLEYPAVVGRTLFINNEDRNEMDVVDLARGVAEAPIALPGCEEPSGLGLDTPHHRLIAACANGVAAVVDVPSRRLVQRVAVGRGPDAVIIDARRSLALLPAGKDGVLDVLSTAGPSVTHKRAIQTEVGARTGALDARTGMVWLPVARTLPVVGGAKLRPVPGTFHVLGVDPA